MSQYIFNRNDEALLKYNFLIDKNKNKSRETTYFTSIHIFVCMFFKSKILCRMECGE